MFKTIFGFFGGWQGWAALFVAGLAMGSLGTWRVMSWHEQAQKVQVLTKTIKEIEYRDKVSTQVVTKYIKVKGEDAEHTITVLKEVPVYVTPEIVRDYPLPCAFVRVFNDAWHGPVSDPAACPDGAPADTSIATVSQTEAINAGQYDAIAHQLIALQEWVREQQAVPK